MNIVKGFLRMVPFATLSCKRTQALKKSQNIRQCLSYFLLVLITDFKGISKFFIDKPANPVQTCICEFAGCKKLRRIAKSGGTV